MKEDVKKKVALGGVAGFLTVMVSLQQLGWLPVTAREFEEHVQQSDEVHIEHTLAQLRFEWSRVYAELEHARHDENAELVIKLETQIKDIEDAMDEARAKK